MEISVESLQYWHWLTFGILLLVAEVAFAGTSFLMWIGFAALFTGVIAFVLPGIVVWQLQLVIFGVSAVASVLLWRRYVKDVPVADGGVVSRRGAEHIGKVVHLEEAIVGGHGRVRINDTLWMVRGKDAPAGTPVRILAQDGNMFDVLVVD